MGEITPALSVGSAARRLGVAASTLRTWDRRYGMSPSARSTGQHRRYGADDLARLQIMHRLILEGAPAAEAARTALAADLDERTSGSDVRAPGFGARDSAGEVETLWRAALAMDERSINRLIRETLRRRGVVRTWEDLLVPVLVRVGDRHCATGDLIEVEHLLSGCVLAALSGVAARLGEAVNARPVLLACAEEEQHSLPIYALRAALAKERIGARMLGARVPQKALTVAIDRLGPAAVFVWSQSAETGDPAPLTTLPALRPPTRLIVGGPGWRPGRPPGVDVADSLPEALALTRSALGLGLD